MLLRLSTLATGHTGIRAETAQLLAGLLTHEITPIRARVRARSAAPVDLGPLSPGALALMGEGEGRGCGRHADARGRGTGRCRARARGACRQGGARADQRHRRHARHAGARDRRPEDAAAHGGHRGRHVGRGSAGHRPGVRPRAAGDPAPGRAGALRRQPDRRAQGLRCRRVTPRSGLQPGAGRLSLDDCAPQVHGAAFATRSSTPHDRPGRDPRIGRGQPGGARRGRACGVERQLPRRHRSPTSSTSWRSSPPTSRRSASAGRTASSTRPAATGSRRSSPTTPASTATT